MEGFLDKKKSIAVVGVSSDPTKYGHKVFFDLLGKGYRVYAVHSDGGEVNGHTRYVHIGDVPEVPSVVTTVVPPAVTEKIVHECKELGIKNVWMQPGSESDMAIEYCKKEGIDVVARMCVMVETD
jgi:predicted CoA-binding protein